MMIIKTIIITVQFSDFSFLKILHILGGDESENHKIEVLPVCALVLGCEDVNLPTNGHYKTGLILKYKKSYRK